MKKCASVAAAREACGEQLIVRSGEDTFKYMKAHFEVKRVLSKYGGSVEKAGIDEFFVDVSQQAQAFLETEHLRDGGDGQ